MDIVATQIRKARKMARLSQRELGERCGWDDAQSRISNYENGQRKPQITDLMLIARVLGIDPGYLLKETNEKLPEIPVLDWSLEKTKNSIPVHPGAGISSKAFALIAQNDINEYRVKAGEFLVVDPELSPDHDQLCVVKSSARAVLRVFQEDGNNCYFISLVPGVAAEPFNPDNLIGPVEFSLYIRRKTNSHPSAE